MHKTLNYCTNLSPIKSNCPYRTNPRINQLQLFQLTNQLGVIIRNVLREMEGIVSPVSHNLDLGISILQIGVDSFAFRNSAQRVFRPNPESDTLLNQAEIIIRRGRLSIFRLILLCPIIVLREGLLVVGLCFDQLGVVKVAVCTRSRRSNQISVS